MSKISFNINGKKHDVDGRFGPDVSLNDYIRNVADLRGTKAMCHEGGCGACVVNVTAPLPPDFTVKTFAVNSCLVSIFSCHGWDITTVEGIGNRTIGYHDIQKRLAKFNGTQCGYCTPGWVMSMYSLYKSSNKKLTSKEIENSFAANMCRCTGYRPIVDAFKTFATDADQSLLDKLIDLEDLAIVKPCGVKCASTCRHKNCNSKKLKEPNDFIFVVDDKMLEIQLNSQTKWYRAYKLDDVFKAMTSGEYKLIAGNTGQGVNQDTVYPPNVIDIFNVAELKGYILDVNLILGAGMTLSEMMVLFQAMSAEKEEFSYLKQFYDHMDLVAHIPVRNIGTIGGNLFMKHLNHEFQSDLFLLFETVGAMMTVEPDDYEDNLSFLRNNVEPWGKVLECWMATSTFRLKKLYDGQQGGINLMYPALKQPEGYTLLMNDFNQLFPQKENNLFSSIEIHKENIIHYAKRKADYSRDRNLKTNIHSLIALIDAEGVNKKKIISMPDFLSLNMKGKIIFNILLPPLSESCSVKTYKIMPRSQNAHAIVNAGFLFKFRQNSHILDNATIVYGSISPTFIHAKNTEKALAGKDLFTDETLKLALESLEKEIVTEEAPPEPSGRYRKMLAIALYYKAILSLCPDDKLNPKYRSGGEAIKRSTSKGSQSFETDKDVWPLNQPIPKIEALVQCSGEATFANDLPAQTNEVFAAFVTADAKPGSLIEGFNTSEAMKITGYIAFYSAKDIPGDNCFTPKDIPIISEREKVLCDKEVKFYGQPAGILVADSEKTAIKAAKLVIVKYSQISNNKPLLSIEDVLASPFKDKRVRHDATVEPTDTGNDVKTVIYGEMRMESQYHYYMEPQTSVANPTEDGMDLYSATQWLDLTNVAVARCLKVPINSVNVIVRRVGGAYGGKISRSVQIACAAALVSHLTGRTCRFILPLQTNMKVIGKRTGTSCNFEVGVDKDGVIQYLKNDFYQNAGHSYNETITAITIQAFHNCYDHKRWKIQSHSVLTDTPSTTWCRAPFSTEGIAMIEYIMEKIAYHTGKDADNVRLSNMSKDHPLPEMVDQLKKDAEYEARKKDVELFNENNRWRKRAIKSMPLSVDIFYTGNYNAIINIYHGDGTVVITHSGIEMGQGINTKAAQVCAYKLGVPIEKISVKPSTSFASPNAMVTGGSVGSESVAFAVVKACDILNERLEPFRKDNSKWEEVVAEAYKAEIDLQALYTFFPIKDGVKTYYVYAVGILELEVDILTGNHEVLRVDILEDTGRSISPEIDVAQIEGAFIMGLGYWTSEKIIYNDDTGKILTDRTWNYKIPGIKDIPADMRIYFRRGSRNEFGVLQSKGTGEPALCLATIFTHAAREALRSARLEAGLMDSWITLENPCTAENIFMAVGHKLEHFKLK